MLLIPMRVEASMEVSKSTGAMERRRSDLHVRASEAMSDDAADTLMGLLPPSGWSWRDVATKSSMAEKLSVLEQRIDAKFEALESRFGAKFEALEQRFDAKLAALEARLDAKLEALEQRFDTKLAALEHKIDRQTWRFSFLVVLVAVGQSAAPHLLSRL